MPVLPHMSKRFGHVCFDTNSQFKIAFSGRLFRLNLTGTDAKWRIQRTKGNKARKQKYACEYKQYNAQCAGNYVCEVKYGHH